jgi:ATP-dependent Clp protease protease subunit
MSHAFNPIVYHKEGGREYASDLFSRLLRDRIIFISGAIDEGTAALVTAQLLHLESENPDKDISLYINSPGGSVTAGLAILDVMRFVRPRVATHVIGQAASMGAVLLAAGAKGHRYALPHARVMIHQPWAGGISGQASDIAIHAQQILDLRTTLNGLLAEASGKTLKAIASDTERDYYLSASEAKKYGLIDHVIAQRFAP